MGLIQALISLIARSAGKILTAAFGWAVVALFGEKSGKEKILLSGLVGAAGLWPILALGIPFPQVATLALALVRLPGWVPHWPLRLLWTVLALAVPLILGWVMFKQNPPDRLKEPLWKVLLRGFPVTVALSASFLFVLLTTPLLKVYWAAQGRKDEYVPLMAKPHTYHEVASRIARALVRHGLAVEPEPAPWFTRIPSQILGKLGGKAFRSFVPERLEYWHADDFNFSLYPSGVLFRGIPRRIAQAHGLVLEALFATEAFQTFDPTAQGIERQLIHLQQTFAANPDAHRHSPVLLARLRDVSQQLEKLYVPFPEWQILYRRTLQLSLVLHGQPLLLDSQDVDKPARSPRALPLPVPLPKKTRQLTLRVALELALATAFGAGFLTRRRSSV